MRAVLRELYGEIAAADACRALRIAESVKYLGNLLSRGEDRLRQRGRRRAGARHARRRPEVCPLCCRDTDAQHLGRLSPAGLRLRRLLPAEGCPQRSGAWAESSGSRPAAWQASCPANERHRRAGASMRSWHRGRQRRSAGRARVQARHRRPAGNRPLVEHWPNGCSGSGFELSIFDRSVEIAALIGSNRSYIDQEIPHLEGLMVGTPARPWRAAPSPSSAMSGPRPPGADRRADDQFVLVLGFGLPELERRPGISYQSLYGEALASADPFRLFRGP